MLKDSKNLIFFLFITAFIEGASVMSIELLGAKLIAPFFGASLYVWSATLAITLSGLASGYFLGAFLSSRFNKTNILFYLLLGASFLVGMMNNLSFWIMSQTIQMDIKTSTVISLMVFLFPPLVLLGSTSPIIINEISKTNGNAGKSAGLVYAISTIGGIICTFIVGFYLITNFGIKLTCIYTAIMLAIMPLLYFIFIKKKVFNKLITVFIIILIIIANKSIIWKTPIQNDENYSVIYKSEGILGSLAVIDINKSIRMLTINNTGQTILDIPTKRGVWEYVHRIATYASLKENKANILVCGLGGGVLANELVYLGFNVDAVEFDQRIQFVANHYFHLSSDVNVFIDDARHFIKTSKKKYDVIILDLSYGENVPSNVYTKECFTEINKLLNKDGFLFLHYLNESKHDLAVTSIAKTIESSGLDVKFLNTTFNNPKSTEIMYFASNGKINLEKFPYSNSPRFADSVFNIPKRNNVYSNINFSEGLILTDDKPIMDILHRKTALQFRKLGSEKLTKEIIEKRYILY